MLYGLLANDNTSFYYLIALKPVNEIRFVRQLKVSNIRYNIATLWSNF